MLAVSGRLTRIQIVADLLLTLYQAGWEPMTPLDMGLSIKEAAARTRGPQVVQGSRGRHGLTPAAGDHLLQAEGRGPRPGRAGHRGHQPPVPGPRTLLPLPGDLRQQLPRVPRAIMLYIYWMELLNTETDILGRFHNISNTTLHEIVTSLRAEWPPGLAGVSSGVRVRVLQSVIKCYTL